MNFESCRSEVSKYIQDNWTTTRLLWDNTSERAAHGTTRIVILDGDSEQVTIGQNGCHRRVGILVAQFFVTKNTGTAQIRTWCDSFANMFKTVKIGDTTFESPTIVRVGDEGSFFQMNVQAPFYVDIN